MKITIYAILALYASVSSLTANYPIQPPMTLLTTLSVHGWAYTVPFPVQNSSTIEKLIQCESSGRNISRPDSNHRISDGILQYNRGPSDTVGSGTWNDWSKASGITGDPRIPADAIRMADWAISNGFLSHWSCAHILKLI